MKFIKDLLKKWSCNHEWEMWTNHRVEDDFGGSWTVYHFICKKCGKFKKVKSH